MSECIIYTAPYGKDTNLGTIEEPVKSLDEALLRTRANPCLQKRIVVREGHYYDVSLVLTSEDANLSIESYPNEYPILYGGIPVTSWEIDGPFLSASLPGVGDRSRDFRLIEVGGEFRQRARLPESGSFRHLSEFNVDWMSTYSGGWRRKPTEEEMTVLRYKAEDIGPWLDINNAEVTVYHEWDESLVALQSVDDENNTMRFSNTPGHPPGAFIDRNDNARTYVVWNVREGMKQPGQWYLDRTNGKLIYWPLPSESPDNLHVVAPNREHILRLQAGAKRLSFKDLTFACAATPLVAGGFGSIEASAAIFGEEIEQVTFEGVTVRNTGGWACRLTGKDIRINGCHFHHTGAGGIHINGDNVVLENSRVHDVGLVYKSAVAVSSQGQSHAIRHNEIHDCPYSGIVSVSPDTVVSDNILFDTMTFMKDGAAIYIAHDSKHTIVSGNAVFSRTEDCVRRYAYYLDEKCVECTVENNLAVNLGVPMLSHMTFRSRFINNVFLDKGPQSVSVLNSFGLAFERNILVGESIEFITPQGNPEGLPSEYDSHDYMKNFSAADGIVSLKNNVFLSASGQVMFKVYLHYKVIRESALEENEGNIRADPMLKDPATGDFSFDEDSPAWAREIQPLSFADAGCTGSFSALFERFFCRSA